MKKLFFLIGLSAAAMSCSDDAPRLHEEQQSMLRSENEVIQIALDASKEFGTSSRSEKKCANVQQVAAKSRSSEQALIYAVNYEDDGYALVAANKAVEPVLAYVEQGSYSDDMLEESDYLQIFVEAATAFVDQSASAPASFDPIDNPMPLTEFVFPRLNANWGEEYPEGSECPNRRAGCTATALAYLLSYDQPGMIELTFYQSDRPEILFLNWSEIMKHTQSTTFEDKESDQCISSVAHRQLSLLCYELGYRSNAIYRSGANRITESSIQDARNTLVNYLTNDITPIKRISSDKEIFESLQSRDGLAYISATLSDIGAHEWICDGGKHITTTVKLAKPDGTYEYQTKHSYYNHYCWGKMGQNDGYYAAQVYQFDLNIPALRGGKADYFYFSKR